MEFANASVEAQAQKAAQPGPSRKRNQGDLEESEIDGDVAGPPRKRRGQIRVDEPLRLNKENALRNLLLGSHL